MKVNLSLAVLAAAAMAFAVSPASAQSKKKGKATKVTVSKSSGGYWASGLNSCASSTSRMWFPLAAIGAVGCSVVYAVPVVIEGFVAPQRKA